MMIHCKNCNTSNKEENLFCESCEHPLYPNEVIIEKLIKKQNTFGQKIQTEFNDLKKELLLAKKAIANEKEVTPAVSIQVPKELKKEVPKPEPTITQEKQPVSTPEPLESSKPVIKREEPAPVKMTVKKVVKEPSELEKNIKNFLSPIHDGLEMFSNVFEKYKAEGKLPIFFMTITGIVAILFGFGYLMQYTFQYLGEYESLTKIGLGFLTSTGLFFIGNRISKRNSDSKFKEYASALISLGIILNYLLIYFLTDLGNFPFLSSALFGFCLIVANTGISILFALKFEAKIISVLSLIGGSLTPFYLNESGDGTMYYLYLWFLIIGATWLAHKIKWNTLTYISFTLSLSLLEVVTFYKEPSNIIFTLYYHLYAYLFFTIIILKGRRLKEEFSKLDISLLSANLSFMLYNLYSANSENLSGLGIIYLSNGILFIAILWANKIKLSKEVKFGIYLIIASFVGFAIPCILDTALIGLFWSIEAITLLILGLRNKFNLVRKEAFIVLSIAYFKIVYTFMNGLYFWQDSIWNESFMNYSLIGIITAGLWYILYTYKEELDEFETRILKAFREIVPIWLASIFFIITYDTFGNWAFNMAIIPIFGFILWTKKFESKVGTTLALAHMGLYALGLTISFKNTGSIHISDQEWFAKIIMVEILATLYILKDYYKLLKIEERKSFQLMQDFRIAFFVILPLIPLNAVRRHAFEYVAVMSWISLWMTYGLHKKLKFIALKMEIHILAFVAGLTSLGMISFNPFGLIAGILSLAAFLKLENGFDQEDYEQSEYRGILQFIPLTIPILIGAFIISFDIEDNALFGLGVAANLLLALLFFEQKIYVVEKVKSIILLFPTVLIGIPTIALTFYFIFRPDYDWLLIGLIITSIAQLAILLQNKTNYFKDKKSQGWPAYSVLLQLYILAAYSSLLNILSIDLDGPLYSILLVIHAITLLFVALKQKLKLYNGISIILFASALLKVIFHDIKDFETVQKVIVLIIIGAILLGASFAYVKLKAKFGEEE